MTQRFEIPEDEFGVVRVFEVKIDDPIKARTFLTPPENDAGRWPLGDALTARDPKGGDVAPDPRYVDAIGAGALEGIGLAAYLSEGVGVAEADLDGDRARLDQVTHPVAVVLSAAYGGQSVTLEPTAPLVWLGSWSEARAAPVLNAPMAQDDYGPAAPGPALPPVGRSRRWVLSAFLAGAAVFLILFLVRGALR
ncbi:MAG: hypothetical protein AAF631_03925 [Pseudomonadota bacterium]